MKNRTILNVACAVIGAVGLSIVAVAGACEPDPPTPAPIVDGGQSLPTDGGLIEPASLAAALETPCPEEDSANCYWRADERGNGQGMSFLNVEGHIYSLDTVLASH